jgi:hypothetical protein
MAGHLVPLEEGQMGRGFSILALLTLLAGLAFEYSYEARNGRDIRTPRQIRDGAIHVMDGGDGIPPPSTN